MALILSPSVLPKQHKSVISPTHRVPAPVLKPSLVHHNGFEDMKFLSVLPNYKIGPPTIDVDVYQDGDKLRIGHSFNPFGSWTFCIGGCQSPEEFIKTLKIAPSWSNVSQLSLFLETKGPVNNQTIVDFLDNIVGLGAWAYYGNGMGDVHFDIFSLDAFVDISTLKH